mgnify:FL=1
MYPPRSIRRFLLAAAAPVLAVALLAGCGGGAAETTNDADPVTESNSEQIDTQGSGDSADSSDATRVCEALTAVDPDTVFAELTFGEPEPSSYQVRCKLPVTNAEYGALHAAFEPGALNHDALKRDHSDNAEMYREVTGLGDEAFILNDTQLQVREGQDAWRVALEAFVASSGPSLPSPEAIEAGLTEIARSLLDE